MITYLILGTTAIVSFICFDRRDLLSKLSLNPYAICKHNEWYRLVTHGFVHADMTHLLVNMFTFWSFGALMEAVFGAAGFGVWGYLGLYFGGMIFASLHDLFTYAGAVHYHSIGASGAVSAILFSSILFDPWRMIYFFALIPVPGILFGVIYLLYCQYMAKRSADTVNHSAHFYGAIYGLLYPVWLQPSLFKLFIGQLTGFLR
ncbi:MAG: rhomboid family intramembrane serine protease [Tannerellaceae bacterium]|jgi:membrane associated rhomboid family serine protease|nr:rhomboid family intramembrane serine protease [Tannerellaceae bacterium]